MPKVFSFSPAFDGAPFLNLSDFTSGRGWGIDVPSRQSAVAPNQAIDSPNADGVDVFAMTMIKGVTYTFDVDRGQGDSTFVDVELDIIDVTGHRATPSQDDGIRNDLGANAGWQLDPFKSFTPQETGVYYIAIHQWQNDYIDGEFRWAQIGAATGDYSLNVSVASLPTRTFLTNGADTRSFGNSAQLVIARDGNDELRMRGGNDIVDAGRGDDKVYGGGGSNELNGNRGNDVLYGHGGADVLRGSFGSDSQYGGTGDDHLWGGGGNDIQRGGDDDDKILGNTGNDRIFGGSGDDYIRGGEGIDVLKGGAGSDRFHFRNGDALPSFQNGSDRINEFEDGDIIDLSDMSDGTLIFIGSSDFTFAGQARVRSLGDGYFRVQVNTDADLDSVEADIIVDARQVGTLAQSDFDLS